MVRQRLRVWLQRGKIISRLAPLFARSGGKPASAYITYIDHNPGDRPSSRVLVSALGETLESRDIQLRTIGAAIKAGGQQPVLVGTHLSSTFLVDAAHPVELLPMRDDLKVLTIAEYESYVRRRWELILAKWDIDEAIDLGQDFGEFLADQIALKPS